jgi:hypothetical protein
MRQASQALQQASQSLQQQGQQVAMGQPQQPGKPPTESRQRSTLGAAGQGRIDESLLPKDMKKYAGKPWGQLPGELRTRIIQDMRDKYGDDYARMIKLYFEQVAETKEKK